MRIKRVSDNSGIEAYFQTMQRFNNGSPSLVKEANWATSLLGFGDEAVGVGRHAARAGDQLRAAVDVAIEARSAAEEALSTFRRGALGLNTGPVPVGRQVLRRVSSTADEIMNSNPGMSAMDAANLLDEETRLVRNLRIADDAVAEALGNTNRAAGVPEAARAAAATADVVPNASEALFSLFRNDLDGWEAFKGALSRGMTDEQVVGLLSRRLKNPNDATKVFEVLNKGDTVVANVTPEMLRAAGIGAELARVAPVVRRPVLDLNGLGTRTVDEILDARTRGFDAGNFTEFIALVRASGRVIPPDMLRAMENYAETSQSAARATESVSDSVRTTTAVVADIEKATPEEAIVLVSRALDADTETLRHGMKSTEEHAETLRVLREGVGHADAAWKKAFDLQAAKLAESERLMKGAVEAEAAAVEALRKSGQSAAPPLADDVVEGLVSGPTARVEANAAELVASSSRISAALGSAKSVLSAVWKAKLVKNILGGVLVGGGLYAAYKYLWADEDEALPPEGPWPGGGTQRSPEETAAVTAARTGNTEALNQALSEVAGSSSTAMSVARIYRKTIPIKLSGPFDGFEWAFVNNVGQASNPSTNARSVSNQRRAESSLSNRGRELWAAYKNEIGGVIQSGGTTHNASTPQHAFNQLMEDIIGEGIGEQGLFGGTAPGRRRNRDLLVRQKRRGRGSERARRREMRRTLRNASDVDIRSNALRKFAEISSGEEVPDRAGALRAFAEYSSVHSSKNNNMARKDKLFSIANQFSRDSTNNHVNNDLILFKEADEVSKSYCKDAVMDLNNTDKTLRTYFTGLGRLYDAKSETPKGDYKTLYNVHDETGTDLIHAAHPKAIVVLDSIGNGGLVENGLEQQRQTQGVALSTPTGNYRANYAWVRESLKKTSK